MSAITSLNPRIVWEQFDAITQVPRPSKKESRIIEFLIDFAKSHDLEYKKDTIGNVVKIGRASCRDRVSSPV